MPKRKETVGITVGQLRKYLEDHKEIPDDHALSWIFEDGQEFEVGALEHIPEWSQLFLGENKEDLAQGMRTWGLDEDWTEGLDLEDPETQEYK